MQIKQKDIQELDSSCRIVMFDMDGTFISSKKFHASVFYRFFNKYVKPVEYKEVEKNMGNTVPAIFINFNVDEKRFPELFEKLDVFCKEQIDDLIGTIPVAPDIKETLEAIHEKDIKTAVVTNSMQCVVESILHYFGLTDLFDYISGADIDTCTKNRRCENVRTAVGAEPENVLYVGDAETDIILANELSYVSCFADTPFSWCKDRKYTYEMLRPDMSVKALKEIPEKIKK